MIVQPTVWFENDEEDGGTISILWRNETDGVLLVIPTGEAVWSYRPNGGKYATNQKEFDISKGIPEELIQLTKKMEGR